MADNWSRLPLLLMKEVLNQLSLEDALAATSTCSLWRHALIMYEGRRDFLKLQASEPERSVFLTRMFSKNARKLHIQLDCAQAEAEPFLQSIMHKLHDTTLLHELLIAGTPYSQLELPARYIKCLRSTVESLLHAHRHTLKTVTFIGCDLSQDDETSEEAGELSGRAVQQNDSQLAPFLTKVSIKNLQFTSLQTLMLEYSAMTPQLLEGLCTLPHLLHLSLTLMEREGGKYESLPWGLLENKPGPLEVTCNIIGVPEARFDEIMENVLVDNIPIVAIRVLFCKVLHEPFLLHIQKYERTLRALHWADASAAGAHGTVRRGRRTYDSRAVNAFILLCWRCTHLTYLTIHGYWVWQYDLLGMARLRAAGLLRLDVSATSRRRAREPGARAALRPVAARDWLPAAKAAYVEQMNQVLEFPWTPARTLSGVHPALGTRSSAASRARYVLRHATQLEGVE